jgi:hypothetical protein
MEKNMKTEEGRTIVRAGCLEKALEFGRMQSPSLPADEVVKLAQKFYDFIRQDESAPS